jgi:hypothetical protein
VGQEKKPSRRRFTDELKRDAGYRHAVEVIEAWRSQRVSSEALRGRVPLTT